MRKKIERERNTQVVRRGESQKQTEQKEINEQGKHRPKEKKGEGRKRMYQEP